MFGWLVVVVVKAGKCIQFFNKSKLKKLNLTNLKTRLTKTLRKHESY